MRAFTVVLKLLAPIPVVVGLLHLTLGPGTDVLLGATLPAQALQDPVLDSQNRFYGTIFMAYGPLLWLCATDPRRHASLFRILAAFIFLGGVARLISIALLGVPALPVLGLLAIELVAIPPLVMWHAYELQRPVNHVSGKPV